MSLYEILPLLPFRYGKKEENVKMLNSIRLIFGDDKERILYILKKFSNILGPESFDVSYKEHQRIFALGLERLKELSGIPNYDEKDKLFADIAQSEFESKTGKLAKNNSEAFRLFLSFVRRKYNIEQDDKYKKHKAKMRREVLMKLKTIPNQRRLFR